MREAGELVTLAHTCRELGVTPSRLRRLVSEGYLEPVGSGKDSPQLYQLHQVKELIPEMPKIMNRWAGEENLLFGAMTAGRRRALEPVNALEIKRKRDAFVSSLEGLPRKEADLLKASFYLYHLNHYAKAGHGDLYELKLRVLKSFYSHYHSSEVLSVIHIVGQQKISLCQECKNKSNQRHLSYGEYASIYGGCHQCKRDKNFYDLFEFNISCGVPEAASGYPGITASPGTTGGTAGNWASPLDVPLPRRKPGLCPSMRL